MKKIIILALAALTAGLFAQDLKLLPPQTNGGAIDDNVDPALVQAVDGLWKAIVAQIAIDSNQLTSITTNTKAAMLVQGVASGYIEQMMVDANAATMALTDKVIYMTAAFATALEWDFRQSCCGCMPWEERVNGVRSARWNGIEYIALPKWDEYIQYFESGNSPYRAVLTNRDNILIGTPGGEFVQDFDMYFDRITRAMYIYGTCKIGAMFANDAAFQAAF